eukprot:m.135790 g.135790  ORF g.135790 m.135790 type:complete len:120 (-) comp13984_c0_seq4:398-757(-)
MSRWEVGWHLSTLHVSMTSGLTQSGGHVVVRTHSLLCTNNPSKICNPSTHWYAVYFWPTVVPAVIAGAVTTAIARFTLQSMIAVPFFNVVFHEASVLVLFTYMRECVFSVTSEWKHSHV